MPTHSSNTNRFQIIYEESNCFISIIMSLQLKGRNMRVLVWYKIVENVRCSRRGATRLWRGTVRGIVYGM